jgi:hypothetical protein
MALLTTVMTGPLLILFAGRHVDVASSAKSSSAI